MAKYENKQTIRHIMGNVGQDPTRRDGSEDSTFVTFSVAVTRDYGDDAEARWYGVSVNREALQDWVMANIHKGSRVGIEGVPSTSLGNDGRTFYNFKGFRIALCEYGAVAGGTSNESFDEDFADDEPTEL